MKTFLPKVISAIDETCKDERAEASAERRKEKNKENRRSGIPQV